MAGHRLASIPLVAAQTRIPHWKGRRWEFNYLDPLQRNIIMMTATHRSTENTRAILPMARILLRMTSFRRLAVFSAHERKWDRNRIRLENGDMPFMRDTV